MQKIFKGIWAFPVAQLPCPAAADAAWTGFPQFPGDQRNKILFCQNQSASGQQMRRVWSSLSFTGFIFFPFSILNLLLKKLSLRGEKANKSWLLLSGGDLAVVWRSWCSVSVSLHSPELYPVMYLFIITDGQNFFSPFSLFCPRPQGSDRDQQHSRSDEAARQKLN